MGMKRTFWRSHSVITQEGENGTPVSIKPKHPRRRIILTLALSGAVGGFLISHIFSPKYTSQAVVLVEGQQIPASYVAPAITADFTQRVQTLSQEIISSSKLRPVVHGLGVKPEDEAKLISDIQQNMQVEPMVTSMSAAAPAKRHFLATRKSPLSLTNRCRASRSPTLTAIQSAHKKYAMP